MTWAARLDATRGGATAPPAAAAASAAGEEPADLVAVSSPSQLPFFTRHGFQNSGNICYANSTVQALLSCARFHALLRSLQASAPPPEASTLRSLADLAAKFAPRGDTPTSSAAVHYGPKIPALSCEHMFATPLEQFEKLVNVPAASTASPVKQRGTRASRQQQDAQEFLSFLLDAAHEEMQKLMQPRDTDAEPNAAAAAGDDDESWVSVGRKNKTAVTRAHEALRSEQSTAVSAVFGGVIGSIVTRRGATPSKTLEPFKILSLDVSDPRVHSISDALVSFCKPEMLEVYRDAHGVQASASRMIRLERLPPVLCLHLKLFSYTAAGEQKLPKHVAFSEQMTIERSVHEGRDGRSYRLAAVVEHLGLAARTGHYVTYARDLVAGWLRFDDATVQAVSLADVLRRPPYLLVYEQAN